MGTRGVEAGALGTRGVEAGALEETTGLVGTGAEEELSQHRC